MHRRKDGSEYPAEVHLQLVPSEDGAVFLAFINDITDRKAVEDRDREGRPLRVRRSNSSPRTSPTCAGSPAGTITRWTSAACIPFRGRVGPGTPRGWPGWCGRGGCSCSTPGCRGGGRVGKPRGSQALHDLDEILRCAERAATLTRQLLTFARRQVIEPVNLNLNTLVADLMKFIGKVVGEHIEVKTSLGKDVPTIHADRGQIEQVVMNLCLNARDAMPEGGRLTVETGGRVISTRSMSAEPVHEEDREIRPAFGFRHGDRDG